MKIQKIKFADVNPAPYNPRKNLRPEDPEYREIQGSLERFGLVIPYVYNKQTGNLVGGHQRMKIEQAAGLTEGQMSVVDLPLEEEKALNLMLNRPGGDWDKPKLADILADLAATNMIEASGFVQTDLDRLLAEITAPVFEPTEPLPDLTGGPAFTADDIQAEQTRQEGQFADRARTVREVTCPHCAQTFGIDE